MLRSEVGRMQTERVRSRGTRANRRADVHPGSPLRAVLVAMLGIGLAMSLPRASPVASNSDGTDAFVGAVGVQTPAPVATKESAEDGPPLSVNEIMAIYRAQDTKARWDGSLFGWRLAPYEALEAAGTSGQNLSRSCDSREAGVETPTQLDFTVGYIPSNLKIDRVTGPIKWVCGTEGLSVLYHFSVGTPFGAGEIWIERAIRGRQTLELDAPIDSVEAGEINGRPAILVHPADDDTGLGQGRVIVIEDNIEPEFTILSITTDDGIPFAELVLIAEGIK